MDTIVSKVLRPLCLSFPLSEKRSEPFVTWWMVCFVLHCGYAV